MKVLTKLWATRSTDSRNIRLLIDQNYLVDIFNDLGPTVFLGIEDILYPTNIFNWLDHDVRRSF